MALRELVELHRLNQTNKTFQTKLGNTLKVDTNEFPLKDTATKIIKEFEEAGVNCILAGGWLRDHVFGKQGKDLDFFIHDPNQKSCYLREEGLFELLGYGAGDTYYWTGEEYSNPALTIRVAGQPYQFVYVNQTPKAYVKSVFDYSINQIFYDGETVTKLMAFTKTQKSKVVSKIWLNPYGNTEEYNQRRLTMLQEKFPDFDFPKIEAKKAKATGGIFHSYWATEKVIVPNENVINININMNDPLIIGPVPEPAPDPWVNEV